MRLYDFEVMMDGAVVAAERAIALDGPGAVWAEVERLASRHAKPGCRIRVTDENGRIVVLTGVAAALRFARRLAA